MKQVAFISVLIFFLSCQRKKSPSYIGNWYFDKVIGFDSAKADYPQFILENEFAPQYNFEIFNDSVFDYKNGFHYLINNKIRDIDGTRSIRSFYYLGTKTNYKVEKSKILFFDKSSKSWDTIKIRKFWNDTMIIDGFHNVQYRLIRKKQNHYDNKSYDAIVVERSPCLGSCPFNSTYLDRNGIFIYKGYDSNTVSDNLKSKLEPELVQYYFDLFDKIPISKLEDNYSLMATDSQTNTVSFFKNGKIVKTISCYIKSPIDLKKAYTELSYAYQNVKVEFDDEFLFDYKVSFFAFNSKESEFRLKESESFFLEVALRNGREVKTKFNQKYSLQFSDWSESSDVSKITTDGRFYQIMLKDKTSRIIDIGYNFISNNPIIMKNRRN